MRSAPRLGSDGWIVWDGLQVDTTERRQADAALRESEDHYRHTVELNPQVTWTAQADGQLNRVANRWNVWTGTTGLGGSWIEAIHPDDREPSLRAWEQSVATGEPYDIEHGSGWSTAPTVGPSRLFPAPRRRRDLPWYGRPRSARAQGGRSIRAS